MIESIARENPTNKDALEDLQIQFYPNSYEYIPSEAKDLLRRILEINPRFRLKSILALQRISMYMNFKVEEKNVLQHSPKKILEENGIDISAWNCKANVNFENF